MKFHICVFFENLSIQFKFHTNITKVSGTLHEDHYIFFINIAQLYLEQEMFQKTFAEKIKIHIIYSITSFENRVVCDITWKNKGQSRTRYT